MLNIIYYKDNPNLKKDCIITVDNQREYLENCYRTPHGWLVKGVHIEEVNGQWIRKKIDFDHELGKIDTTDGKTWGVVKGEENGYLIFGFFTPNVYKNSDLYVGGKTYTVISPQVLHPKTFIEEVATGIHICILGYTKAQIAEIGKKKFVVNFGNHQYCIDDNGRTFEQAKRDYAKSVFPIDKDLKYAARYLQGISFGVELETINGNLPKYLLHKYGIVICKDGSTKRDDNRDQYPPEYVTVPLEGAKGLQTLRDVSGEVAKRSEIDLKCSYHVHFGGFKFDRIFFVAFYRLCYKIQNDVFLMFPYYKLKHNGVKEKNYCQRLPNIISSFGKKDFNRYINHSFLDLYKFLSGGKDYGAEWNRKVRTNPWPGGHKWDIKTRYYWVNLTNPFFGKRDTAEFRIHTPTLNADKIINWIFMCAAIVKFAENCVERCINAEDVTFEEVLNYYAKAGRGAYSKNLSKRLIEYYKERVEYYKEDHIRKEYFKVNDLNEDEAYKFPLINQ